MKNTKLNSTNFSLAQIEREKKSNNVVYHLTPSTKKFFLLMPPPNVTGSLHLGHALNNYIQDVIVRWNCVRNISTSWVPGFDHAGIATEILVNKWMRANHLSVIGREEKKQYFLTWTKQKKIAIREQWKKMNLLIDQKSEMFTLDEKFTKTVKEAFVSLYNDGLIYRDQKLVNWDCELQTAISDIEVLHQEKESKIYYFKYKVVGAKTSFISVATTRPETMFGDQAIVVHPNDDRYKKFVGKKVINPVNNEQIPIITDLEVNPDFATGAVKCTPAHDFFDFKVAKKNNLKFVKIFDESGKLTSVCGSFNKMDRFVARQKVLQMLQKNNHLLKEAAHTASLPVSSRTNSIIEPFLTSQWFIKTKDWAKALLQNHKQIDFIPKKYQQNLRKWLMDIQDWCISRQLTWGHQLPIYTHKKTKEVKVSINKLDSDWVQSPDVLDTWFSSGLWSLVYDGWTTEKKAKNHQAFPIDFLVTSYDIIFFWVARMLFLHHHFTNQIPFKKILIHGLVRTEKNEKMSKSRGNVLNPIFLIEEYGSDALRFYLLSNHKIGEDLKFDNDKLIVANKFAYKLWNIYQLLIQNDVATNPFVLPKEITEPINSWIINQFIETKKLLAKCFDQTIYSIGLREMTKFIRQTFSNFYLLIATSLIENQIAVEETRQTMNWVWLQYLALLHPFFPKLTTFFWRSKTANSFSLQHFSMSLPPEKKNKISVFFWRIIEAKRKNAHHFRDFTQLIYQVSGNSEILNNDELKKINIMLQPFKCQILKFSLDQEEKIIIHKEKSKKELDQSFLKKELERAQKILANKEFIKKADPKIVSKEKAKLEKYKKLLTNKI